MLFAGRVKVSAISDIGFVLYVAYNIVIQAVEHVKG